MRPAAHPPADEQHRQAILAEHCILDTPPDPRFDAVTRLAAELFGAPIAAVSLLDRDRQWFKSSIGLEVCETPRSVAFCDHAIRHPEEVLMVADAALDPRFSGNPLVLGSPHIRFYAGAPIRAEDGTPLGTLCVIDRRPRRLDAAGLQRLCMLAAQVSSLLELHRKTLVLQRAAAHDVLTGLPNRRLLESRLREAVEGALAGRPCALLLLDLDRFKEVNDALGHEAGDAMLREVGRRLTETVRGTDLVARLGGDEFAVLMNGPVDPAAAQDTAERIMSALTFRHGPAPWRDVRSSVGIALGPQHGASPGTLMRAADQALYAAKRAGRGRFAVAGREPRLPVPVGHEYLAIERELRAAIDRDELHLYWQPSFAAASERPSGFEALVRWTRPGHGPIPAGVFIPVAELSGLVARLDAWVIERACAQAVSWPAPLSVSVNVSAYWFGRGDLLRLVTGVLARTRLPASRLVLELTERTLVEHTDGARECIAALRALGVRVALDDFGTGYSCLAAIRNFAFDELKLDRSFVRELGADARADAVAEAVLRLGRSLGMEVCAEGVEEQRQLEFLRRAGCDRVQGYLLGRPSPTPFGRLAGRGAS